MTASEAKDFIEKIFSKIKEAKDISDIEIDKVAIELRIDPKKYHEQRSLFPTFIFSHQK